MKRIAVVAVVAGSVALGLAGCGKHQEVMQSSEDVASAASLPVVASLVAPSMGGPLVAASAPAASAPVNVAPAAPTASSPAAPAPAAPASASASSSSQGAGDETISMMATGDLDLKQCPGASCMALGVIPQHHRVKVDPFDIRMVKASDGVEEPWVKVAYEGDMCWVDSDCSSTTPTAHPVEGWVDYKLLVQAK